ncbi:unnamed protein product [Peniophora sp. CBMAI 1063]|nr:unnamed protein product [Peniophora sp. CBMAI 1063]
MGAADPSYPLLPIALILAAVMLLLVLLLASIRQQWNFGVAILCFWLFLQNATAAANTIIWSDNVDIKLEVYCDIVSRLQVLMVVVKPMSTLIISRRLYCIVSLLSVDMSSPAARKRELLLEWTLGVIIPLLIAGPIYYIDQSSRFEMDEGFGCTNAVDSSIFGLLMLDSWSIILPLISITCYYPRVAREFYLRSRDVNRFLQTNNSGSVSRTSYFRLFALASIDILITLPDGITSVVLNTSAALESGGFPFYNGWKEVHRDWTPPTYTYEELLEAGPAYVAEFYATFWSALVLSYAIFALFGSTAEARATYWRAILWVGKWFGWKPAPRAPSNTESTLGTIQFDTPPIQLSVDLETGTRRDRLHADKAASQLGNETSSGSEAQEQNYEEKELQPDCLAFDSVKTGGSVHSSVQVVDSDHHP